MIEALGKFVAVPALCGLLLATPAARAADDPAIEPSPARLAQSGIAHAPRVDGHFENADGPLARASFWKWRWQRWVNGLPKPPEHGYDFPIGAHDGAWLKANRSQNSLTWIGHATALLQIAGLNVLTDPVFSERASPVSFLGPQRRTPPGLSLAELPHIDVVLISHSHYDHLDRASVQALNAQPGGPPRFLVPMGIKAWLADQGIDNAEQLNWGDRARVGALDFWFVPATHWSARSLGDRNDTLWGGWAIKTTPGSASPYSVYFAGDTGYSNDSRRLGQAFGGFDLALLPIGAYAPRWFMGAQHVDPQQAVQIFRDVGAKKAVGIHWGTFELADEPLDEPPKKLAEATRQAGLAPDAFVALQLGQTVYLRALPAESSAGSAP